MVGECGHWWCCGKYIKERVCLGMSGQEMYDTWLEIVVTAEACKKATAARWQAKHKAQQKRAAAAFRDAKTQQRIQAAFRIAAKMQQRKTR